jgi:hypothetical protein
MKPKDEPFAEDQSFTDITVDIEAAPRLVAVAAKLRANCAALDINFEELIADLVEIALNQIEGQLALRGIKGGSK